MLGSMRTAQLAFALGACSSTPAPTGTSTQKPAVPVEIRVPKDVGARSSVHEARESAERDHILRALEETNWNVSGAARALGMDRTNLHKRIRTLGLARER